MACSLCDRPARVPEGAGRVFVSVPVAEIVFKILDLVRGWPETLVANDGALEGPTPNFSTFLERFLGAAPWSDLERHGITVLFLPPGRELTFSSSRQG